MDNLYETGILPAINKHLDNLAKERRDYKDYWSASSAGYCMRRNIFERLKVPYTSEDARKQRVFSAGHIFHEWIQRITVDSGVSIAQELELRDESLLVLGHIDDLVLIGDKLVLYDYKTQNSRAFTWQKGKPMSYFHRMQLGTYMYMLRNIKDGMDDGKGKLVYTKNLSEARILKISKDDLRMAEQELLWTPALRREVEGYWMELNDALLKYTNTGELPECTCHVHENGFLANEKYNPFYFNGQPCSVDWYDLWDKENKGGKK
jgi:hypothetical protein